MACEPVRRPRDRKDTIIATAAGLFRVRGYHNVALSDVAAAVGVTAPALYRHVRNKQELLLVTVRSELDVLEERLNASDDLDEVIAAMASIAAERRGLAALWQREAKHLPAAEREVLREQVNAIARHLAHALQQARPEIGDDDAELLGWAVLAAVSSLGTRRVTLAKRTLRVVARDLARAVAYCSFTARPGSVTRPAAGLPAAPASRREQLLTAAAKLFDEHGFQSVSMSDIGAAVGIAGPSIYKHFRSKSDILAAVMVRASEQMIAGVDESRSAADAHDALAILLRSDIRVSIEHSHLIGLLISERSELPDKERRATYRAQKDYLHVWVQAVCAAYPDRSPADVPLAVGAVFAIVNNLVRTARTAARDDLTARLTDLAYAVLGRP